MFRKLKHFLEDPKYPSVGPYLRLLNFVGLWKPNQFKQIVTYTVLSFFFAQYVKSVVYYSSDSFILLLHHAPFHVGVVKTCLFLKDYKLWEKLIEYISLLERNQLSKGDVKINQMIKMYIARNRRVTYFYFTLGAYSIPVILAEPYLKIKDGTYGIIFDVFSPLDKNPPGYYASMVVQTISALMMSSYVCPWDVLIFSLMVSFTGQLRIARFYCANIFEKKNHAKSHRNIAEFHHFYTRLIRYQKLFNSLISPVMFVYLVVVSVNLGYLIIQLIELQGDFGAFMSNFAYVSGCLIQLLLFYWHSNDVIAESLEVSYGVFESDWLEADKRLRKEIALLSVTTTKRLVFRAGLFSEMSLSTFISILRRSYSFYALMKGTK